MREPDRQGYVRVRGHRLFYRRIGEPVRGTVIVLHGGPGLTHEYLTPLADLAGAGYAIVFYDQFGCGRSERPPSYGDYTIQSAADDVELVRRGLRLGRVHLFGHSYGGALALETAVRYPRSWRSLIVSSGFASMKTLWKGQRVRMSQLSAPSRAALLRYDRTGVATAGISRAVEEYRKRFTEHMENTPFEIRMTFYHANRRILSAMGFLVRRVHDDGYVRGTMAGWDVTSQIRRLRIRTLVTVGQFDHVTPACAREIQRAIRRSRIVIGRGQGHLPFFEDRDRYITLLSAFLRSSD